MSNFTHLHLHTEFSTLDGINRIDVLPDYIKGLGQTACAQTEHGNVSGSLKFYKACRKADIKPILGMEAYYSIQDRTLRERDHLGQAYYHMILLAQNNVGLHNLFKLSSHAYTSGLYHKPRIDDALLAEYAEGIIATSACLGSGASQLIMRGENKAAEKLITHHAEIFKDRFLIEVQLHEGEQQDVNKVLIDIAQRHKLPLVLTNDCHYMRQEDKGLHELALCMQTKSVMSNPKRFTFGDIDVHVAHHDWLATHAKRLNIPYEAISNTVHISDMINADDYFSDTQNRYPKFQGLPEGMPSWTELARLSKAMLTEKMGGLPPQVYQDRINMELKAIKKMGFSDYLLIVWEFLNGARDEGVWIGPGRGSAAGSLVAYALNITQVDPIKHGLIFERFLNVGRSATPLIFNKEMLAQLETMEKHDHTSSSNRSSESGSNDGNLINHNLHHSSPSRNRTNKSGLGTNLTLCLQHSKKCRHIH